ncbi:MAG: ankyrin repeat domain-containing protein [Pseudomonadota bacterium]|nr:ankyrin repeat domain-containing protein [Pseudomonadota bacterium]
MTPEENAHDQELLERYKHASDTLDAAPSEAVRAAILAEARRVAEQRATETPRRPAFDVSRPAANDSRWKITAFGTAGTVLVAALLFAPRLWESGPVAPATSSGVPAAAAPQEPESPPAQAPRADKSSPRATAVQPRRNVPMPPERQQSEEIVPSAAPAEQSYAQNYARAAPPPAAADSSRASAPRASRASSLNAERAARAELAPAPTALLSAAASGDVAQTTLLLDQGAALDARDDLGRTPLMLAVLQARLDVVRLLLNRGADPNLADSSGRTPLRQAKQARLSEIAATLERAGAR